ncbi:NADH-quinone oxidoreductase subunit M [Marinobacterium nitratireducens]|uniref:NADH-quinone oxidoreductase subunit M n=1 Tax=Marinobacterium nitratireducens TaxID=518897 RepID=A0A918DR11_9GAMM|nr:NADH-quinone oxidoreductase subunit M [Marinobacterium nitratireducens]GGO78177.1 NADH-quinone oxidoreductase subunit M [Marinobacterium nitratireducens]
MILVWLLLLPLLAALFAPQVEHWRADGSRWLSLTALGLQALLLLAAAGGGGDWWLESRADWLPRLGIGWHLGLDGLSYLLLWLTVALGAVSVLISWREIRQRVAFFHCNLMLSVAGIVGVFLALDLFLFFVFWELMLIPMVLLIAIWGHDNRRYAATKFFIFTQASSLLMLIAILGLAFAHQSQTGTLSFDRDALLRLELAPGLAYWLMLGFFVAFAVKLPMVPLHTWLPDAHTEAPTAGSVLLAAILLKTGAYGLLRFSLPLFPAASADFSPVAMALGVAGILYGAKLAFAQDDMKRLVAYTSVSHMGFVLLGIYALNGMALQGAVMQMLAHGFSTAALFIVVGMLQERWHTRDLRQLGGLWTQLPRLSGFTLLFALASLGLPGLANFIAEFLILAGAFQRSWPLTAVAALGLVGAALYALLLVQRGLWGGGAPAPGRHDCSRREWLVLGALALALFWFGLHPQPVLDLVREPLVQLLDAPHHAAESPPRLPVGSWL